jgi:hypothetical protein
MLTLTCSSWVVGLAAALLPAAAGDEVKLLDDDGAAFDILGGTHMLLDTGRVVSLDGDVLVVGVPADDGVGANDVGTAVVFRRTDGSWAGEARLGAAVPEFDARFATSVAASGDVIVCGSPYADTSAAVDAGTASVFRWDGNDWLLEQTLEDADGHTSDLFGSSVAVDGDVLVVGAFADDPGGVTGQGSATVFRWNGAAWVEEQRLLAATGTSGDTFGHDVSMEGDVIAVGAPRRDAAHQDQGAVFVFRWDGATWQEEAELLASAGDMFDSLGRSVSISGGRVAAGAFAAQSQAGAASVFAWNGSAWSEQAALVKPAGEADDHFGSSVALDQDVLVVGARDDDVGSVHNQGSLDVFRWDGAQWLHTAELRASDGASSDHFGWGVEVEGETVVSTQPSDDDAGMDAGAVYVLGVPSSAWCDQGCALAGVNGDPSLVGEGSLVAGTPNAVNLTNAAPSALSGLFLALSSTPLPFKGGTLKPFPFLGDPSLSSTDLAGEIQLPFVMPPGVPAGTEIWAQFAIADAASIHGVALSSAILGVTP